MMEYANLPGILFDRFFAIVDTQNTGYADIRSFLVALCKIYYSNIEVKIKFAFDIYDFDKDGYIHKEDVRIVMSFLPIHQIVSLILINYKVHFKEQQRRNFHPRRRRSS